MQNDDPKKMIQQGFDTVAAGYDHPSLSFFPETAKRLLKLPHMLAYGSKGVQDIIPPNARLIMKSELQRRLP